MNGNWQKWLFYVAATFDAVLGIAFLFLWRQVFQWFEVTPPNHAGYVQFPAMLLIVFGFLFLRIAREPSANRDLIPYGMGLKAAFSGVVFWNQMTGGVPSMWLPWAWVDLVFLGLFLAAYQSLARVGRVARA